MAYLIANGESDERYPADVLDERNRIAAVAEGRGQLNGDGVEVIDGAGMTLMPGLVEGRCHLPFVDPMRNQDLGEIPPEEHLLRTCGRGGSARGPAARRRQSSRGPIGAGGSPGLR
jgi:hypothetical protein